MTSSHSLINKSTPTGATIDGVPIYTIGSNPIKISDNVYDSTPQIHKALLSTGYTGKFMKKLTDFSMMKNNKSDIGYTSIGDKKSKHRIFP